MHGYTPDFIQPICASAALPTDHDIQVALWNQHFCAIYWIKQYDIAVSADALIQSRTKILMWKSAQVVE